MKAFGVRLAAGAVTILLGAIMAAQASKDQQASTDSAWTEDKIPPGQAASPIGSSALMPLADLSGVESLKPIGDARLAQDQPGPAVQLVQHVESTGAMGMPSIPTESGVPDATGDSVDQQSIMKMRLPRFDDAPSPGTGTTPGGSTESAGPAMTMGLPISGLPNATASDQPKLSDVRIAETPSADARSADAPSADARSAAPPNVGGLPMTPPRELSQDGPPANDLRGNVMPELGGSFGDESTTAAWDDESAASFSAEEFSGNPTLTGGPALTGNPALSDSVDPAAGIPAAMLTPVSQGGDDRLSPELAAAPGMAAAGMAAANSTLRIHREPPVQFQTGTDPGSLSAVEHPSAGPAATIGFASQPQIVGQADGMGGGGDVYNPQYNPSGMAAGDQGYAQPVAGYEVPQNYGNADTYAGTGGLPAPQLPMPSASTFEAPPMQAQNQQAQPGFSPMPGRSASFPSGAMNTPPSIYQSAGHKQVGGDLPLPAGPTMASPGERYLDGPQSPSVVIHKRAPAEVKVGKPASFVITVKNVGGSKALDVQVHDRVPTGMTLTDATPRPNPKYQPELFWQLGDLEPNQERTITLQLTPEQEGELGSVARVTFQAAASVRTISTRPELKIVQKAPEKVLIGQQLEIELEVSNPGTGEATGVILQEDVPAGLEHPQGSQLDNLIGDLGPGEIRRQILRMRAVKPGIVQNQIRVKGDDGLENTHTVAVEVIAPELKATLTGPSRRFLERQATYNLEVANVGTADATNVELSVQLDRGFTFVKTDREGQYDASRHAVFWSLPALPVGQSGSVPLTLLPVEEGDRVLRTDVSADLGIQTTSENQVRVESLAELTFSINDSADPIEVGGQTIYEIRISNSGSRDDTNVQVALQLPPGLQLVEQGDFTPQGQGIIKFSPRALLKANDDMTYRVKAQGIAPGRHLVKAIVTSDQSNVPVTKEESIMVYSDR